MKRTPIAHVLFPRANAVRPVLDYAWDAVTALAATRDLDVEVLLPLPVGAMSRPQSLIRRLRGKTPWPNDFETQLQALEPRPTIVRYVPVLGRSIESATVAIAAHLIRRPRAARPRVIQGSGLDESGFAAVMAARAVGCASIAVAHGTDVRAALGEIEDQSGRQQRARTSVRNATRLLAASSDLAQSLARLGARAEILRFTTFASHFPEAPRSAAPEPREVLFVGQISRAKGVDLLIEALSMVRARDTVLRLIGRAAGDIDPLAEAQARGLSGRVLVEGEVPQNQLPMRYARSRCVVLPSRHEGFGNVLIEALLSGRPVIGSDVGGIRDIITSDRVGVLVPPNDPRSLAAAIDAVLDAWGRDAFAPSILRAAARPFTWETQGPRLADVTRNLIQPPREHVQER